MIYLSVILGILLIFTSYYMVKFGLIVVSFQESLEDSLEIIDEKYNSISEICERPLFYDSPEVRRVLEDIRGTRDALHQIAYSLSSEFNEEPEEEE